MPDPTLTPLQDRIAWTFTVPAGPNSDRYGELGGKFYRQHLVDGRPVSTLYPPREIARQVYEFARKQART